MFSLDIKLLCSLCHC